MGVWVKKDEVEKAIVMLVDEGEEGDKRRKKARELGDKQEGQWKKEDLLN